MGHMTQTGNITVAQAARILGISRWTVVRKIKAGELLADKLDGSTTPWLLNAADVHREAERARRALAQDGEDVA
jgi:excisionase family DNA binding protein